MTFIFFTIKEFSYCKQILRRILRHSLSPFELHPHHFKEQLPKCLNYARSTSARQTLKLMTCKHTGFSNEIYIAFIGQNRVAKNQEALLPLQKTLPPGMSERRPLRTLLHTSLIKLIWGQRERSTCKSLISHTQVIKHFSTCIVRLELG